MMQSKKIDSVEYQLLVPPETNSCVLEFLDEEENPFMEITIDEEDHYYVTFYRSNDHVTLPLDALLKGVDIAKERIKNIDFQNWKDNESEDAGS